MSQKKTPEQLLLDIEGSRLEISATLDQVQQRTSREALGAQLQRTSLNVSDRLEAMVMRKVDEVTESVGEAITRKGNDLAQMIRAHPLPATLVGIGGGLLAASVKLGQGRRRYGGSLDAARIDALRSEVEDASTAFDERAGYLESTRGRKSANPLVVGIVAAALGVAIGLLIPASRYENDTLGQAGTRLRARAWEKAREASGVTEATADEGVGEAVVVAPEVERYDSAEKELEAAERARDRAEEGF